MKDWIKKQMAGRYGIDQLSLLLIYLSIILYLTFFLFNTHYLGWLALIPLVLSYYRIFSKKIYVRQQEYFKFLRIYTPIKKRFKTRMRQIKELKTHKYFKCPNCHQMLRVPRHKGKITITCQKCHHVFQQHS